MQSTDTFSAVPGAQAERPAHLQELQGAARQAVLAQRLVQAVSETLQVAQHAAKAAKGQRALACTGITNLHMPIMPYVIL